jgi:hypothetical protein
MTPPPSHPGGSSEPMLPAQGDEDSKCPTCKKSGPNYSKGELGPCSDGWHFRDEPIHLPAQGDEALRKVVRGVLQEKHGAMWNVHAPDGTELYDDTYENVLVAAIEAELHKREAAADQHGVTLARQVITQLELRNVYSKADTTAQAIPQLRANYKAQIDQALAQLQQPKQERTGDEKELSS